MYLVVDINLYEIITANRTYEEAIEQVAIYGDTDFVQIFKLVEKYS